MIRVISATLVLLSLLAGCSWSPFKKDTEPAAPINAIPKIAVVVEGVDKAIANSVAAHITLGRKACNTAPRYVKRLSERANAEAKTAMQAYGYYSASVHSATEYLERCPHLRVSIDPGKAVEISKFDFSVVGEAQNDKTFEEQVQRKVLSIGNVLHHGDYESAKQHVESIAIERGYLEAKFVTAKLIVNPTAYGANIVWVFDSGPRFRFGKLDIAQSPEQLDRDVIERLIEYDSDAPYHVNSIAQLNSVLGQSGYFSQSDVRPKLNNPVAHTVPIDIALTPSKRHSFSSGLGVSTDEGMRGKLNYLNRHLNRRGHRLNATAKASLIEQSLSVGYQIPREFPQDEWLSFQGGIKRQDTDSFKSTETQVSVSATKRRPFGILESHYVEFDRQDFDIGDQNDVSLFLVPGVRWTKAKADDALYPKRAYAVTLELRGAADALLSDTSFTKASLGTKWITSPFARSRILLRSEFGAMWVDDFANLTPSERFLTGGDATIRGYDYQELGPVDDDGEVVGGTYLGVLSFEYEYLLFDQWAIASFADAGNAFGGDGSSTGIVSSVGIGARWRSPIGPVRFDLAHPFDKKDAVVFHLRIGPDL